MKVNTISKMPESNIVEAARMCYGSESDNMGEKDKGLIRRLFKMGHNSPFENCCVMFKVDNISRVCLAQLTRHRIGFSYAVKSQRYCKEENFGYFVPEAIADNEDLLRYYKLQMQELQNSYNFYLSKGIKPEDARYILPNACLTDLTITTNLRALFNFFELRLHHSAQKEIRCLANLIKDKTKLNYPITMAVWEELK